MVAAKQKSFPASKVKIIFTYYVPLPIIKIEKADHRIE
jgi:hypothetical protein